MAEFDIERGRCGCRFDDDHKQTQQCAIHAAQMAEMTDAEIARLDIPEILRLAKKLTRAMGSQSDPHRGCAFHCGIRSTTAGDAHQESCPFHIAMELEGNLL